MLIGGTQVCSAGCFAKLGFYDMPFIISQELSWGPISDDCEQPLPFEQPWKENYSKMV